MYPAFLYITSHIVLLITGTATSCSVDGNGPSENKESTDIVVFKLNHRLNSLERTNDDDTVIKPTPASDISSAANVSFVIIG